MYKIAICDDDNRGNAGTPAEKVIKITGKK